MSFRRRVAATLLILYWIALFAATHLPGEAFPRAAQTPGDKTKHFVGYALLAWGLGWVTLGRTRPSAGSLAALLALIAMYGVFDELTQAFVPARSPELADWLADLAGAIIGLSLYVLARVLLERLQVARRPGALP